MDSVRPSIVAQQNQAPPPYYPASGLENKALEHSMDLALAMEEQKVAVYGTQNGYGYHPQQSLQVPGQHITGNECESIPENFIVFLLLYEIFGFLISDK